MAKVISIDSKRKCRILSTLAPIPMNNKLMELEYNAALSINLFAEHLDSILRNLDSVNKQQMDEYWRIINNFCIELDQLEDISLFLKELEEKG